jgi:hypothetical protein
MTLTVAQEYVSCFIYPLGAKHIQGFILYAGRQWDWWMVLGFVGRWTVIQQLQGADGDFYYILDSGRADVLIRKGGEN